MNRQDIEQRRARAFDRRRIWEVMWEDCIDYCMPARQSFFNRAKGQERTDRVFDETPIVATAEFASRMQSAIMPPGRRWFEFTVSETVEPATRKRLLGELEVVADYLYKRILQSNLDTEVHESMMDLAIGTCAISCELDPLNRLVFKTAPLPTVSIEEGPDGRVSGVFRDQEEQSPQNIEAKYGVSMPDGAHRTYTVREACVRNYDDYHLEAYEYYRWIDELDGFLVKERFEGWGSSPWISARWSETAEEWYGRGPLINLLPAIRSVNLVRELIFENAEMAIGGIFQYPNDGTINPETIEIAPNTFIPKAPGSAGIEPLQTPTDFNVAEANLQDLRETIRRGLYSEGYTPTGKTPLSAQEVAIRQADLAQRIGSPFARIIKELANPIIIRAARLYSDAGLIEIPEIDGEVIAIEPISPLARAQNAEDINRMTMFIQTLVSMMGPEATGTYIRTEETVQAMAQLYGYPQNLLHDNQSRVDEVEQAQQLGKMMETAVQTTPRAPSEQIIQKGELQPRL